MFLQDLTGEYQVELVFTMTPEMTGKTYSLDVTNGLGTTKYEFTLALSEAPAAGKQISNTGCASEIRTL